jgi:3-oxoadipate enol-lactonase
MPELVRDGASIYYEVTGAGPAIVLGHSLLADVEMWRGVAPRLAERYRVINVEVRGHRRSTAPAPFTLEDLAGDWLAILDAERIDRAMLVGLSMGGMTAMRLALRAPERVAGMVLLDSNADPEGRVKRARYAVMEAIYARFGAIKLMEGAIAKIMLGRTSLARHPELVTWLRDTVARHDRRQLPHALRAVNGRGPIRDRLSAIATPTYVLVGDEDVATPPDRSEAVVAAIRGARLERIPGAGHLSALEQPEVVATRIRAFLDAQTW